MTARQRAFWALFALTMAVYLAMLLWSLPIVTAAAGGLIPFDLRPSGYNETQAREFLAALSDEGRAFYLRIQHRLDFLFPGMVAVLLAFSIHWLYRPTFWIARMVLILLPFIGAFFDYLENYRVAGMLVLAPGRVELTQIASASQATVLKSGFMTAAMVAVLVGLGLYGRRKWRQRE